MHEFNNRIDAQRSILKIINAQEWTTEPLLGLSRKALNRWVLANRLDTTETIVTLLHEASGKLFFLAAKSQEQITEEYRVLERGIEQITRAMCAVCEERKSRSGRRVG